MRLLMPVLSVLAMAAVCVAIGFMIVTFDSGPDPLPAALLETLTSQPAQ